jgi:hypothetical protein
MATHGEINLQEPSTVTARLDSITLDHNSTIVHREVMVLGSPETTNALTAVLNAAPASTAWGAVVRPIGTVTVAQSTAADLNVTVAGYVAPSTTVTVNGNASSNSSLYIPVRLTNGTAFLSAGTDYADGSTASNIVGPTITYDNGTNATMRGVSLTLGLPVRNTTSSGGGIEGSTATPAHTVLGMHVRQALSSLQSTTVLLTSSNSTVILPIISSVAGMKHKIYAYAVFASTSGNPSTLVFLSNSTTPRWAVGLSSGFSGAVQSVTPPAFLFESVAQANMAAVIESASTAITARVSLSWFTEP